MIRILHLLLMGAYLILPVAAAGRIALTRKRRQGGDADTPQLSGLLVTVFCGMVIAVPVCFVYGYALRAHIPLTQFLTAIYFATSLLLFLRCFDLVLLGSLRRIVRLHRPTGGAFSRGVRTVLVLAIRAVILSAVALPFAMAAVLTYRPKVLPLETPLTQLGYSYERVEFTTRDGVKLAGWWIPAIDSPRARRWDMAGRETAIVCHGLAAGKANEFVLARRLVPGGLNVLLFDFRGHGESGGQLTGYGELEKQDVLAAVKWVRESHPAQSEKIVGVGVSTGAVALLEAAVDPSSEGSAISAVATYAAYDDFHTLITDATEFYFREPMPTLVQWLAFPIASVHAGVDLAHISPERAVPQLWPRPILFIHGEMDEIIPIERGRALYDAATQPKYYVWFPKGTHNDILNDESAARIVLEFFRVAGPVPVI